MSALMPARIIVLRWLAVLLLASVLGNAMLFWAAAHYRDKQRLSGQALLGAVADAEACSAAVNGLSKLATDRAAAAKTERVAAKQAADKLYKRADRTLSKPQGAGTCEGMQALGDEWLRERGQ